MPAANSILFDATGKIVFRGGQIVFTDGSGNSCCCGPAVTCADCPDGVTDQYDITYAGVVPRATCLTCTNGSSAEWIAGALDGTWRHTWVSECTWEATIPIESKVWSGAGCTGSVLSHPTTVISRLTRLSGGWQLVAADPSGYLVYFRNLFTAGTNCLTGLPTINNGIPSYFCNGLDVANMGLGGTATLTPI